MKTIEDNFLRNRVDLLKFTEDNISFVFYRHRVHDRVLQDVGQETECLRDIFAEGAREVHGLLPRRVCIEVGTEVLNLDLQLPARSLLRSLDTVPS